MNKIKRLVALLCIVVMFAALAPFASAASLEAYATRENNGIYTMIEDRGVIHAIGRDVGESVVVHLSVNGDVTSADPSIVSVEKIFGQDCMYRLNFLKAGETELRYSDYTPLPVTTYGEKHLAFCEVDDSTVYTGMTAVVGETRLFKPVLSDGTAVSETLSAKQTDLVNLEKIDTTGYWKATFLKSGETSIVATINDVETGFYASVDPLYTKTSEPVAVKETDDLFVTTSIEDGGYVKVEVLNASGNPISGYTANDCTAITSGEAMPVSWGSKQIKDLAGQTVSFRFLWKDANEPSYQVTSPFDLAAEVALATPGSTYSLEEDETVTGKPVVVPAGVTLDLCGNVLTAANVICTDGTPAARVIDSVGTGKLSGTLTTYGDNGGYLPVKDNDGYRFYYVGTGIFETPTGAGIKIGTGENAGQMAFVFDLRESFQNQLATWLKTDEDISVTISGTITSTTPFKFTAEGKDAQNAAQSDEKYTLDYEMSLTDPIRSTDGSVNNVFALFAGLEGNNVTALSARVTLKNGTLYESVTNSLSWAEVATKLKSQLGCNWDQASPAWGN